MLSLILTNGGVRHDDHDICVGGEDVNEGRKVGVPHFHALERGCEFTGKIKKKETNEHHRNFSDAMQKDESLCRVNSPTAEFKLFDNVTDLLKPVSITLLFALIV